MNRKKINSGNKKMKSPNKMRNRIILFSVLILMTYFVAVVVTLKTTMNARLGQRSPAQEAQLIETLNQKFPQRLSDGLSEYPYAADLNEINVKAESAIIVDTATGSILYEKNADKQIPPASMTKLVEMYVVFQEIQAGKISMTDIVPLPPESWEINIPWDATRMHLAEGQKVSLRELLLGLAISSANDASIAVANYVSGNMEDFVQRMNDVVTGMGLTKTHFVESSGYSEENITTAKEFATFARLYINRFPQALTDFHSQKVFKYPQHENLPEGDNTPAYTMYNTNKLLDEVAGCDGLKTGYIDESGYNISVTAEQNGTRFLTVTMGGPGNNSIEGNKYRVSDNLKLMEFAFANFADYYAPQGENAHEYTVGVFGAKQNAVKLVPAMDETFTVPMLTDSPTGSASSIQTEVVLPKYIYGKVECGQKYGEIIYNLDGHPLRKMPLVADRNIDSGFFLSKLIGKTATIFVTAD